MGGAGSGGWGARDGVSAAYALALHERHGIDALRAWGWHGSGFVLPMSHGARPRRHLCDECHDFDL